MFNNKRIQDLENSNKEMMRRIEHLENELAYLSIDVKSLKAACSQRVGERTFIFGAWQPDDRPTATAMQLINQLLKHQKLIVEAVPASPAVFTLTKSKV